MARSYTKKERKKLLKSFRNMTREAAVARGLVVSKPAKISTVKSAKSRLTVLRAIRRGIIFATKACKEADTAVVADALNFTERMSRKSALKANQRRNVQKIVASLRKKCGVRGAELE